MDNLRNLSSSLPTRGGDQPGADLLSSFKAAALSVTKLYKTAAADQTRARAAGYQDALDELLTFLDNEKLGLMDGEGWRVRAWATERWVDDGRGPTTAAASEDEEHRDGGTVVGTRSSSPEVIRKGVAGLESSSSALSDAGMRHSSEPPTRPQQQAQPQAQQQGPPQMHTYTVPSASSFAFCSAQDLPTMDLDALSNTTNTTASTTPNTESAPAATIRLTPRQSARRDKHNHNNNRRRDRDREQQQPQSQQQMPTLNFNLGMGAGSKRKLPYPDFFDISGVNFEGQDWRKDGGGNNGGNGAGGLGSGKHGKRGRHA